MASTLRAPHPIYGRNNRNRRSTTGRLVAKFESTGTVQNVPVPVRQRSAHKYNNFGTNTRNRARPRTYSKLWSAETRTDLDGPMIIVDSEPPPFFMTY